MLLLRNTKGAPGSNEYVAVPFSTSNLVTRPARRTLAYLRSLRGGPPFRHIDRHGRAHDRLTARSITPIVRRAVTDVLQLDAAGYTSHSLRAGFVTEARAHGVPDELIARHPRHAPRHPPRRMLNVYDRPADLLERPALGGGWW